jgi:hypothetical protein
VIGDAVRGWWTVADRRRRDESVVLLWWILGAGGAMVLLAPAMAMRHVLLAVPPVVLLLVRAASSRFRHVGASIGAAVVTASLGAILAVADWSFANVYRQSATTIAQSLHRDGSRVWFVGHWGWQWYGTRAGMAPFDQKTSELKIGDSLVQPSVPAAQTLSPEVFHRLERTGEVVVPASQLTVVRTFTVTNWGGYYAFFIWNGTFPFRFSDHPLEVFTIYRVVR